VERQENVNGVVGERHRALSTLAFDYGRALASRLVLHGDQAGCSIALFFGSFFCASKRKNGKQKECDAVELPKLNSSPPDADQNDKGSVADAGEILRFRSG